MSRLVNILGSENVFKIKLQGAKLIICPWAFDTDGHVVIPIEINIEVEKGGDDITANNCLYVKIFVPEGEENEIPEGYMKVALNQLLPDISLDTIPMAV